MTKPKSSAQKHKEVAASVGFDAINDVLHNRKKLFWLNFQTGFVRGLAGVFGAAIAVVLIGFLVAQLGWLPYIGDFLQKLGAAVST